MVNEVLNDLGAQNTPMITVYNKCDLLKEKPHNEKNTAYISAKSGAGLEELLNAVDEALKPRLKNIVVKLSYSEGARLAAIQAVAEKRI